MTAVSTSSKKANAGDADVILRATGVRKTFMLGPAKIEVLRGTDVSIRRGEFVAIEGRSGSGKSTLLHLLGLLDKPDAGRIDFEGRDVASMAVSQRNSIRNKDIGFVFQFYHLLPELNVLQNTMLAAMVGRSVLRYWSERSKIVEDAKAILERVGLAGRMKHRPNQLSGGERQRVAIARALMNKPKLLLADEPTGNLDAETGRSIMNLLEELHAESNQTIVMVTHDRSLAREADRVMLMTDGVLRPA